METNKLSIEKVKGLISKESYEKLAAEGYEVVSLSYLKEQQEKIEELEATVINMTMRARTNLSAFRNVSKENEIYQNFAESLKKVLEINQFHQSFEVDEE
ncbi:hypothetical protein AAGG74_16395 [Bacillus mexicanus]|uniref:hypothetical protein n=1 Tax=Bacillus mexicanus TaxID=2834415 RepID=UPI003D1AE5FF